MSDAPSIECVPTPALRTSADASTIPFWVEGAPDGGSLSQIKVRLSGDLFSLPIWSISTFPGTPDVSKSRVWSNVEYSPTPTNENQDPHSTAAGIGLRIENTIQWGHADRCRLQTWLVKTRDPNRYRN